jgi:hypothetical protein
MEKSLSLHTSRFIVHVQRRIFGLWSEVEAVPAKIIMKGYLLGEMRINTLQQDEQLLLY